MIEIPSLRPETRYGMPSADQILFNRDYIIGYSYLFRQPRWALELIDPERLRDENVGRVGRFRTDLRIPEKFRSTDDDYLRSGYDRGHLISSQDRQAKAIHNSETFLFSNMSPQVGGFNQDVWKTLEEEVRTVAGRGKFVETYAICGPLFDVGKPIKVIGENRVVVPHAYFKSILSETARGTMQMWAFIIPNEKTSKDPKEFLRSSNEIEQRAGLSLWDRLRGEKAERLMSRTARSWPPR